MEDRRKRAGRRAIKGFVLKSTAPFQGPNERALHEVYRRTIAFGGHPNERSVLSATVRTDTGETYTYAVAQLTDRPLLIAVALKATVEAAVGALRTFRLVFPERFEIMGLDRDVERLVHQHNAVFVPAKA